jgi:hypothetical protein
VNGADTVSMMRSEGHDADVVDPLTDDLDDPAAPRTVYDAVWANASLLHARREDLPTVLTRLAGATKPGGLLYASLKEGDGESWSVHGTISAPRFFTYWREEPLRRALQAAGWSVEHIGRHPGSRGEPWLEVLASRS